MASDTHLKDSIQNRLKALPDLKDKALKDLFLDDLKYDYDRTRTPTSHWRDSHKKDIANIEVLATHSDFKIIWARLKGDTLRRGDERPIINTINRDYPYNLLVFSNCDDSQWDFVNVKLVSHERDSEENRQAEKRRIVRRITVSKADRLRTAAERLSLISIPDGEPLSPLELQKSHDDAFDVEKVTKEFYTLVAVAFSALAGGKREVKAVKQIIRRLDLRDKLFDIKWWEQSGTIEQTGKLKLPDTTNHKKKQEFAVRLIGRLVFCWFLKRKRSESGNPLISDEILSREAVGKYTDYYRDLLEKLFFEVMNTKEGDRRRDIKDSILNQTPFLNGGLFEPHDDDYYQQGIISKGGHHHPELKIPNWWFEDLFSVFEAYNFTIDENTSIDIELSIDPEMLGKIFENLLAEINPETGETARKSTGSYYTPRPIVEYMVDESLKQYLTTKTGIEEDRLSKLLAYDIEGHDLKPADMDNVIDALGVIKIIDPACGSGAFPMGILQKMLLILQKVDPDSKKWLARQLESIPDRMLRERLKAENVNYIRKLGIIKSAIYGVDIQPIAVEISKLRFFLSLVVDAKKIEPLPNLEFKFVAANSLIGLPKPEKGKASSQGSIFEDDSGIDQLRKLRDEYLTAFGKRKKEIEKEFRAVQHRLLKHSIEWRNTQGQTLKLAEWDPFSHESSEWFEPEWMFGIHHKFDIVIANPPYLRVDSILVSLKERIKVNYTSATGKYDLYYVFFELALMMVNDIGTIVFITPNKYCAATSALNLRQMMLNRAISGEILSTSRLNVFQEAANYPIITILKISDATNKAFVIRQAAALDNLAHIDLRLGYRAEKLLFLSMPNCVFPINISKPVFDLIIKSLKGSIPLGRLISISEGLRIPSSFESENKKKFQIVKQFQIERYSCIKQGTYISEENLQSVVSKGTDRHNKIFQDKLLIAEDGLQITATIDLECGVPQGGIYFCVATSNSTPLKYILGLINSRLFSFLYEALFAGMHMGGGYLRYRSKFLESMPIPDSILTLQPKEINAVIELVDNILLGYAHDGESKNILALETKLDNIIYGLYNLNSTEIAIVEGKSTNSW